MSAQESDLLIERLLRVIDEGRRTATYKPALLLAIIDAVAEVPSRTAIPTREIAQRVLRLYWPQTREFPLEAGGTVALRQISMKSSTVITAVLKLRATAAAKHLKGLHQVAAKLPAAHEATLDEIERTFVAYPIPLLQVVGTTSQPFLYTDAWGENTKVARLVASGAARLTLMPGVADRLVTLGPMLRPLIELVWTQDVAKWTKLALEEERLRHHLFGTARTTFPKAVRDGLRELQRNECFYCGDALPKTVQVDHFLAWSRWPNDAIENLVLADRCNGAKSDHLATVEHLTRWRVRGLAHAGDLVSIASAGKWESAPVATLGLMTSTYGHLPAGTPLWKLGKDFEYATGPISVDSP